MGGNLFTHAMSEAEVQAHEVCLKVKAAIKRVGGSWLPHACLLAAFRFFVKKASQ
jgi:hypothetical protein